MATKMSFGNTATAICAAVAAAIATSATFSAFADSVEQRIGSDATLWLDASDISTITTNASGEVTRWNSRVGSNYAKQSTHYQGVAMPYPHYDVTTYGVPTVDFGEAKTDGGWSGANLGMDLRLNETVPVKTVFWVARMKDAGNVAWMGIQDFDSPFRRGGDGQYAMIPNAKFANFWNGQDAVVDMANDHPPADEFCVYSAQMDNSATYNAEYLASHCFGLHSGGKQLSELIIFNRALSDDERIEVTQYLQCKWAKSRTVPIAHRWSFNGTTDAENLTDSIGGVVGKKKYKTSNTTTVDGGTVNWSNGKAVLEGGGGKGFLNLGQGVLGTGNAVTLELWVTKDENVGAAWGYFFSYNKPDTKNLFTLSSNHGSSSSNDRNMIQTALNGTAFADGELTYLPKGETYHYALTLQANGNGGTIMRWMAHDAATGRLVGDVTKTAPSWTLAANASDWSLTLGCNPWINSTYNNPSSYDEVRVWNGVLGDEQLKVNAMTGPDASPDAAMTSSDGFTLATNATFHVNSDYTTAGTVILGEGSKLQFNGPAVFTALGGISIPAGDLADYVVADTSLYNVIAQDGVITVTSKAGSASWTGAGRAGDVTDPNNWDCRDGFDNAMPGELPSAATAVTVSGTGINLQAPMGTTLQCASFTIRNCTLAADCDWCGLPVTPSINGTVDLNGHDLRLNRLSAVAGSALSNGGNGVSGVVFDATAGNYNESAYVDGVTNLGTSENARIVILRSDDDSVSSLNIGNTVGVWTEVRLTNGTFSAISDNTTIGKNAGARGSLAITYGADVTLGDASSWKGVTIASGTAGGRLDIMGGKLTTLGWVDVGWSGNTEAKIRLCGGEHISNCSLEVGRGNGGTGYYEMSGGTFSAIGGHLHVGQVGGSTGYFSQSGGEANVTGGNFSIAYNTNSRGTYNQTGGTLTSSLTINIGGDGSVNGTGGTGEFDIGSTVNANAGVNVGGGRTGTGHLVLNDGGVLTTSYIKKGAGTAHATFAGGKIVAKDANNAATFISGIGDVKYADGGLTVDTAGHNVSMTNNTVSDVWGDSALVKQGAGTLTVDALPPVDAVKVEAGTLRLSADGAALPVVNAASGNIYVDAPSQKLLANNYLLHRWGFNGHGNDLVGTNHATFNGTAAATYQNGDTEIKIPGGARGTAWIDCGSNIIPAELGDTPFTIEMWVKVHTRHNWDQWFALGNSSNPAGTAGCLTGLIFAPKSGAGNYPSFRAVGARTSNNVAVGSGNLTENKEYHVAAVVTPTGGSTATVTLYIEDPSGEEAIRVKSENVTNWSTATIVQDNFWLGHSHWNDNDAAASYNEVRVWAAAFSQAQVQANGTLGANTLPVLSDRSAIGVTKQIDIASGATLDLGGHTLTQSVISGNGTISGGTLNANEIRLNVGDCLTVAGGTFNIEGAKVNLLDPEHLATPFWFIKTTNGGRIVGTPVAEPELPSPWKVSVSSSGAKLMKRGFSIHLR